MIGMGYDDEAQKLKDEFDRGDITEGEYQYLLSVLDNNFFGDDDVDIEVYNEDDLPEDYLD